LTEIAKSNKKVQTRLVSEFKKILERETNKGVRNMELKTGLSNDGFWAGRFAASLLGLTSFGSYKAGYTAHSVRRVSGTSDSPIPLYQ